MCHLRFAGFSPNVGLPMPVVKKKKTGEAGLYSCFEKMGGFDFIGLSRV